MTASSNHYVGAPIVKNSFEELRISLDEYGGRHLLNLRVFYERGGEMLPGKQGVAIRVTAIPELVERLKDAETEAKRLGLLSGVAA